MSDKFAALLVTETSDNLFEQTIVNKAIDELPANDVLIRVEYSSLNFKDALSATGNRGVTKTYPHTPGIDAAGTVEDDASGTFSRGDKVIVTGYDLGMNTSGGLAEYIRVPAEWVISCPAVNTCRVSKKRKP